MMRLSFVKFVVAAHVPVLKLQGSVAAEPKVSDTAGFDITADEDLKFVRVESLRQHLPNPNDLPVFIPMTNVAFFRVQGEKNTLGAKKAKEAEEAEKRRLVEEQKKAKDGAPA